MNVPTIHCLYIVFQLFICLSSPAVTKDQQPITETKTQLHTAHSYHRQIKVQEGIGLSVRKEFQNLLNQVEIYPGGMPIFLLCI